MNELNGFGVIKYDSKVYLLGGKYNEDYNKDIYQLDLKDVKNNTVSDLNFQLVTTGDKISTDNNKIYMVNDKILILNKDLNILEYDINDKQINEIQIEGTKPSLKKYSTCFNNDNYYIYGGFNDAFEINSSIYKINLNNKSIELVEIKDSVAIDLYPFNLICKKDGFIVFGNHENTVYTFDYITHVWNTTTIAEFFKLGYEYNVVEDNNSWYIIKDLRNIYYFKDNQLTNESTNGDVFNKYFQPIIINDYMLLISDLKDIQLLNINNNQSLTVTDRYMPKQSMLLDDPSTKELANKSALRGAFVGNLIATMLCLLILIIYIILKIIKFYKIRNYQHQLNQQQNQNFSNLFDKEINFQDSFQLVNNANFSTIESNIASFIIDEPNESARLLSSTTNINSLRKHMLDTSLMAGDHMNTRFHTSNISKDEFMKDMSPLTDYDNNKINQSIDGTSLVIANYNHMHRFTTKDILKENSTEDKPLLITRDLLIKEESIKSKKCIDSNISKGNKMDATLPLMSDDHLNDSNKGTCIENQENIKDTCLLSNKDNSKQDTPSNSLLSNSSLNENSILKYYEE